MTPAGGLPMGMVTAAAFAAPLLYLSCSAIMEGLMSSAVYRQPGERIYLYWHRTCATVQLLAAVLWAAAVYTLSRQ